MEFQLGFVILITITRNSRFALLGRIMLDQSIEEDAFIGKVAIPKR